MSDQSESPDPSAGGAPARQSFPRVITESTPLTPKEEHFVAEYLVAFNGTDAARKAGYAWKSAAVTASQLLRKPNIQNFVERGKADWRDRTQITAERVARDIDIAANLDVGELFDARGNLLPVRLMPPHVRRCIVSIEVVKRNITGGDGETDEVYKVKLIDKGRMHEILGRHTGVDKGDVQAPAQVPAFALPAETPGVSVH